MALSKPTRIHRFNVHLSHLEICCHLPSGCARWTLHVPARRQRSSCASRFRLLVLATDSDPSFPFSTSPTLPLTPPPKLTTSSLPTTRAAPRLVRWAKPQALSAKVPRTAQRRTTLAKALATTTTATATATQVLARRRITHSRTRRR